VSGPGAAPTPGPPGTQPERTRLAWRRTVLTSTVVALLAARLAAGAGFWPGVSVVVAAWLAVLTAAHLRIQAMAADRPVTAGRLLLAPVLVLLGYAALGITLTVMHGR
jgi:hypothetical protein